MYLTVLLRRLVRNLADGYFYRVARTYPVSHVYNQLRRWLHYRRYGVKSASMFRNVELEVNSMCNRTCSYCPNASAKRPAGYMEESLFRKIVDELGDLDFDGTVSYHFYGEPLLDKRLPGFVEYTARRVPHCTTGIYSNGDFLTLEIFREYISSGLGWFLVTQHDNHLPDNLQRILMEATEDEKGHIVIQLARDMRLNNRGGLITTIKAPAKALHTPCDWPLGNIVVTMDGNILPCCNDYFESEVMGNVRTNSLRDVWSCERFDSFRRALSRGDRMFSKLCISCDVIPSDTRLYRIVPQ